MISNLIATIIILFFSGKKRGYLVVLGNRHNQGEYEMIAPAKQKKKLAKNLDATSPLSSEIRKASSN